MNQELPWESTVVKSSVMFPNISEKRKGGGLRKKIWSCENCDDKGFEGKMK